MVKSFKKIDFGYRSNLGGFKCVIIPSVRYHNDKIGEGDAGLLLYNINKIVFHSLDLVISQCAQRLSLWSTLKIASW